MFGGLAKSLFGSSNDRYVKSLKPLVAKIAAFEPEFVQAQRAAYMETCAEDDEIAERMDQGRRALMMRGENQVGVLDACRRLPCMEQMGKKSPAQGNRCGNDGRADAHAVAATA